MWLDPFCHNLELANQADHEDDLPENLSEITDLWNSPARTHVRQSEQEARQSASGREELEPFTPTLSTADCVFLLFRFFFFAAPTGNFRPGASSKA